MAKEIYRENRRINRVDLVIIALFLISIFSFLIFTGTLDSGYHFTDDHGMISIETNFKDESYIDTTLKYIKNDLSIRFRPLYYAYYILSVKIFDLDFLKMSAFVGVMASATFSFFYMGMRKLGNSQMSSALFVLLIFLGSQSSIWWRLGTNETIAIFFLGLAFLFMAECLDRARYKLNNVIFVIFLMMASLCKESFIIIIPAFVLFKIWNEKNVFDISAKESIKNNYWLAFPMILMLVELGIIKFVIGTNKIGYAGMTSSLGEFISGIKNILFKEDSLLFWVWFVGGVTLLYFASFVFLKERRKVVFSQSLKSLSVSFLFSLMIVLPNIFMHAKSGMAERYLLPTTLGLSFLIVGIFKDTKLIFFKGVMLLGVFVFLFYSFGIAKKNAINFADEGKITGALLSAIRKSSNSGSKILLVADPVNRYEVSWSLRKYLSFYGVNDFYAYPINREYKTDFERGLAQRWGEWFKGKNIEDVNGKPDLIVIIDKFQTTSFFSQSGVLVSEYGNIMSENDQHALYLKK